MTASDDSKWNRGIALAQRSLPFGLNMAIHIYYKVDILITLRPVARQAKSHRPRGNAQHHSSSTMEGVFDFKDIIMPEAALESVS